MNAHRLPAHADIVFSEVNLHLVSGGGVSKRSVFVSLLCRSSRRKGVQNFCSVRRLGGSTLMASSTNLSMAEQFPLQS